MAETFRLVAEPSRPDTLLQDLERSADELYAWEHSDLDDVAHLLKEAAEELARLRAILADAEGPGGGDG